MLYRRGSQWWYRIKWSIRKEDGSRERFLIQKSARTANKRRADEVQEEHRRALRLGLVHPKDPWPAPVAALRGVTLRDFAKDFLRYAESHTKPGTSRFYSTRVQRILTFAPLADADLTSITGDLMAKYIQWRRSGTSKNAIITINGEIRTLRRLLRLASEWGQIPSAPALHELPGEIGRDRVISFHEEVTYLTVASATLRDLAILAVDTGLRPNSELFPLRWSSVRLEGQQDAPYGFLLVRRGKTRNSERLLPLTPRSQAVLHRRFTEKAGAEFVFPGAGTSGHITTVQHAHERAIRRAGLNPFEFYVWRHTFGTRCAESGMDRFTLARLMGHSSPRVAERYYVHVSESHVLAGFTKFMAYTAEQNAKLISASSTAVN